MGALPSERVVPALAFTDVGLDFTGPIYLKNEETGRMRNRIFAFLPAPTVEWCTSSWSII